MHSSGYRATMQTNMALTLLFLRCCNLFRELPWNIFPTQGMSCGAEPVCLGYVPLVIVVGDALDMLLCNEEAEPCTCLSNFAGQEVTVVPWNKHDRAVLQGGEPVGVCNLSEHERVNFFGAALERVDTIYLLQHDTLD